MKKLVYEFCYRLFGYSVFQKLYQPTWKMENGYNSGYGQCVILDQPGGTSVLNDLYRWYAKHGCGEDFTDDKWPGQENGYWKRP